MDFPPVGDELAVQRGGVGRGGSRLQPAQPGDDRGAAVPARFAPGDLGIQGDEADGVGFEVFNITAADTLSEVPTEELIGRYAPSTELRQAIPGPTTAFSIDKARWLLGYVPAHTWRADR